MSTFEKDKINQQATFRRVQSFVHRYERKCSKKLGWISSNLLGFFFLGFICTDVQILQHLFGYILICFFFSLFTKKKHM